jgi:enamine deaminase RidA (YjgF/YER057c/UK114 family)
VREHPIPQGVSPARGYSHVVSVSGGRTVYIAGQIALDAEGHVVGRGDLGAQARRVFENLKAALAAAGATFADVVKMNTYVVNLDPANLAPIREVRAEYLPSTNPPASTLVGVTQLAVEGLLIEVEMIAVVGA